MAKIRITTSENKKYDVKGGLTFEARLIEVEGRNEIEAIGQLTTHKYIDDISKIETNRYLLTGIEVYKEVFGSDDFNILYEFIIKDYTVKNGVTNLGNELIDSIENELYKDSIAQAWEGDDE